MYANCLTQLSGFSASAKAALHTALFKTKANRDVLVMLHRGEKTVEGAGSFSNNGTAASFIANIRTRILKADLKIFSRLLFKDPTYRASYNAIFQRPTSITGGAPADPS